MVIRHRFTIGALAAFGVLLLVLAPADASSKLNTPRTATRPVSALSQLRSAATLPKLSTRPPVRNTALVPKTVTAADQAVATATAAAATPLPISAFSTHGGYIAVDNAHQHVFISGGDGVDGIAVMDFSGTVVTTLETGTATTGLVVDEASGTLYAALYDDNAIALIDTANLTEIKRWPGLANFNPQGLAIVDGKAWYPGLLGWGTMQILSLDLTTGDIVTQDFTGNRVAAVPGHPDSLVLANEQTSPDNLYLVDLSTTPPTVSDPAGFNTHTTTDLAETTDGVSVVDGGEGHAYDTSNNFATAWTFAAPNSTQSVATQGGLLAVGSNTGTANLKIFMMRRVIAQAQFTLSPGPVPHGLAFSGDGTRLFALVGTDGGAVSLVVETEADLVQTNIGLPLPHRLKVGTGVTAHGTVTFTNEQYDGLVRTLHVSRTDTAGTHALPDVSTDTTGGFTVTDAASPLGKVTYTVTYDGDTTHRSATQATAGLREVPFDINGDGFADLVVGSPGEDIGAFTDTGSITVLPGSSTGVTGTGSKEYDLNTAGVPGTSANGDQFGWSQVSGDFNGDGYPDVAVSANALDIGGYTNSGGIWIFYGSATGLRTDNITMITEANLDQTDGIGYASAFIGEVMTSGDFDGDGIDDLVTGVFGNHWEVVAMYGATGGLTTVPHIIEGNSPLYGSALSAGDINGDGRADLAVGAPLDLADKGYYAGALNIFYGSATGLNGGRQYIDKDIAGVPGSVKPFTTDLPDEFGAQVVLADFTGDGRADLAVGAPGSPVTTGGVLHQDAGTVTAMYSVNGRISTAGAIEASQATAGVPGSPGTNDDMGAVMTGGDSNADGKAELVIFSPGDHLVTVVKGAAGALSFSTATYFTQNSPGIPGADEPGDFWGDSLRFGNFKSPTGPQALAVGADGENTNQGAVTVIYSTTSGLTGTGSVTFTQNSAGIPGASENGDLFGSFFSF